MVFESRSLNLFIRKSFRNVSLSFVGIIRYFVRDGAVG